MIVIRTAPRPGGVDYLTGCIEACEKEGVVGGVIFYDQPSAPPPPSSKRWATCATGGHLGSRAAGWKVLGLIADYGGDVLLLEDDARPVAGMGRVMHMDRVPEWAAFSSFFSYRHLSKMAARHMLLSATLAGSVALKVPFETAQRVLDVCPLPPEDATMVPRHGFDRAFGLACSKAGLDRFSLLQPSLVEHVGDVSIVSGRRKPKRAAWLAGSKP